MNSEENPARPQSFPALTGLRAIAALMVFFHHYNPFAFWWPRGLLQHFFSHLHVGVALFFVLSGFLITHQYYPFKPRFWRTFLLNRFARIYPLLFILTLLTWIFQPEAFGFSRISLLLNLTMLKGFFRQFLLTGVPQAWSLTVESTFYLLAPMLFIFLAKDKRFLLVFPAFFLLVGIIIVLMMKGFVNNYGFFDGMWLMLVFSFFGRSIEFFCGISLSIFFQKLDIFKTNYPVFTIIGTIGIISGIFGLMAVDPAWTGQLNNFQAIGLNHVFIPAIGFAFLIFGLAKEKSWLSKMLKWPLFQLLGKSSYAFYLIHLGFIARFLSQKLASFPLLFFISLQFIAVGLYFLIEEPCRNFLRRVGK